MGLQKGMTNNEEGRPTLYRPEFVDLAFKVALLGATDKELAGILEVHTDTINRWKEDYPEFKQAINDGKGKADAEVANALFRRAKGFEYDEVSWERIDGKDNLALDAEGSMVKQDAFKKKVVTKLVPPDVAAANIWLKNRRGKSKVDPGAQHWADKQETGFTDNEGNDLENLPISFK